MGRGTTGIEQLKMSNYNGDRLRGSAETMCVFRKKELWWTTELL